MVLFAAVAVGSWWLMRPEAEPSSPRNGLAMVVRPSLITDRPEANSSSDFINDVSEKGVLAAESPTSTDSTDRLSEPNRGTALVAAGRRALENGDLITARSHLSDALEAGVSASDLPLVRAELTRIGLETIFSPRIFDGDPFVERYVIKPGDSLGKIAKVYKVSAELIASVNAIRNPNRIRAGQAIKIIKGPFRAEVEKGTYSMGVYLDRTFVKQFPVGLGQDGSTPRGTWRVATKLKNPTYYPPRGGQIVAADDPKNPLGERWIGLQGVSGEAVGQLRYGVHGTNEPDTIGKSVSLGCIRMYNEDVEALYQYLVEKHSTVTVR